MNRSMYYRSKKDEWGWYRVGQYAPKPSYDRRIWPFIRGGSLTGPMRNGSELVRFDTYTSLSRHVFVQCRFYD